jgi:ATP/maltotriose-dependent transcriptional regulator MalT
MKLMLRPRLLDRIASACARPITLIVAPAGYGKSVAVNQFLATFEGHYSRFDAGGTDLSTLVSPAGDKLDRFDGAIVVDGLERGAADDVKELVASIERTKSRIRWILASRSSVGLPIGTWLAYGDCELVIDAADLRFTVEEFGQMARDFGLTEADDVSGLFGLTDGWPVAVNIALQAFAHSSDRRVPHGVIRDASQSFWLDQVYNTITDDERSLLAVAAALPEVDVGVLDFAKFANALEILEGFRARTGLLEERGSGVYSCPEPFREFLRRQTDLQGARQREAIHVRAARALELSGNVEPALASYVTAHSPADVLRLLENNGFDLLERGRGDVVSQAIDALDDSVRRASPRVLALRGVLQSLAGNPVRAEVLLRRSLSRAKGDRDLAASTSLRLALLLTNRGLDISDLLLPIAEDLRQSSSCRAEAWSLLAAQRALGGEIEPAREAMQRVEVLLCDVEVDSVRAKVLQRIGVAAIYIGESERAREVLVQSAELAMELQLFSLASRAYANLSNLMLHRFDDVSWQLWYAQQASTAALNAGDAFDIETASLQLLDAELRCGIPERSSNLESQLGAMRAGDQSRTHYLIPSKALRLAWEGNFAEAHRLLSPCWNRLHHDIDRAVSGAQCALYLALDRKRQSSIAIVGLVENLMGTIESDSLFSVRSVALARLCSAVAEAINGRFMHAERISHRIATPTGDPVEALMASVALELVGAVRGSSRRAFETMSPLFDRLIPLGYAHAARLLDSVRTGLLAQKSTGNFDQLTRVERDTLRLLAEGLSPKEIAARKGRSVHTVRTHIANAISKLRCNGRGQAIALGRRMGILD